MTVSGGTGTMSGTASDQVATYDLALALSDSFTISSSADVTTVVWGKTSGEGNWINGFVLTPEPSTLALLALGGLLLRRRR